ncbi:hypothetical protein QYE76_055284 [Lolium multiflorum]|uniref:Uncharacterized protein n=1 Tax=Lolium multiflorum TaxID=4521 RepID=A0AAD8T0T4_LOLMU|nr:hypothetical protein QYE76_055284 [Lolium multiflorum]
MGDTAGPRPHQRTGVGVPARAGSSRCGPFPAAPPSAPAGAARPLGGNHFRSSGGAAPPARLPPAAHLAGSAAPPACTVRKRSPSGPRADSPLGARHSAKERSEDAPRGGVTSGGTTTTGGVRARVVAAASLLCRRTAAQHAAGPEAPENKKELPGHLRDLLGPLSASLGRPSSLAVLPPARFFFFGAEVAAAGGLVRRGTARIGPAVVDVAARLLLLPLLAKAAGCAPLAALVGHRRMSSSPAWRQRIPRDPPSGLVRQVAVLDLLAGKI